MDDATPPRLSMAGIAKAFPGVQALQDVSFDARASEVHAICGENGAGKSTLMKILGGVYQPDAGTIAIDGAPVRFVHPLAARDAGIGFIHQELSILPDRTVAENIFLGIEPTRGPFLHHAAMRDGAARLLARIGAAIDPGARAGDLSVALQQQVEIAKALAVDVRILVMDEPTAALDDAEAVRLLELVRQLRSEGVTVVYISHRMAEISAIADRVTVLKDGRLVATRPAENLAIAEIVRLMVGRELADFFPPRPLQSPGAPVLEIEGAGNGTLDGITLEVRAGEIVGVAGLEGSGKAELAAAVIGDVPFSHGEQRLAGRSVRFDGPRAAIAGGLGYLPGDRKREGLALRQSVRDNARLVLRALRRPLQRPRQAELADAVTDERLQAVDVRAGDFGQEIRELSGGNQQKAILARWLARAPRLLVFVEPTRGIDVAAKAAIYRIMREFVTQGRGILMVSSDLPEIVGVSDRILVMRAGRIVGELPGGAEEEAVVALAVGHDASAAAA